MLPVPIISGSLSKQGFETKRYFLLPAFVILFSNVASHSCTTYLWETFIEAEYQFLFFNYTFGLYILLFLHCSITTIYLNVHLRC